MRRALPLDDSGRTSLVNPKQVLPVFIGARVSTHYLGLFAGLLTRLGLLLDHIAKRFEALLVIPRGQLAVVGK
jgi:hypothetical protein